MVVGSDADVCLCEREHQCSIRQVACPKCTTVCYLQSIKSVCEFESVRVNLQFCCAKDWRVTPGLGCSGPCTPSMKDQSIIMVPVAGKPW